MQALINALAGKKSHTVGWLMVAMGVVQAMGILPPETLDSTGLQLGDPGQLIGNGLAIIALRLGIKKVEDKVQ